MKQIKKHKSYIAMKDDERLPYLKELQKSGSLELQKGIEEELKRIKGRTRMESIAKEFEKNGHYINRSDNEKDWWDLKPLPARTSGEGYVSIDVRIDKEWNINNPHVKYGSSNGKMFEHRYVWEKANNEYLLPGNTVHHINGKRNDNQASNLERWGGNHLHGVREDDMVEWSMNRIGAEKAKSFYRSKGATGYIMSRISSHYFHTEKSKEIISDVLMEFYGMPKEVAIEGADYMQNYSKEAEEKTKYDTLMADLKTPAPKNKFNSKIKVDV
jgi:hypothetical protein